MIMSEKMLQVLTINRVFLLRNVLRKAVFVEFSTHTHCGGDWTLSVVEKMGLELAAIHNEPAETLHQDCCQFF